MQLTTTICVNHLKNAKHVCMASGRVGKTLQRFVCKRIGKLLLTLKEEGSSSMCRVGWRYFVKVERYTASGKGQGLWK